MSDFADEIATYELPLADGAVCAYCAAPATHIVGCLDYRLAACCCDEPTHWAWLVAGIQAEQEKL